MDALAFFGLGKKWAWREIGSVGLEFVCTVGLEFDGLTGFDWFGDLTLFAWFWERRHVAGSECRCM